MYTVLPDWMLRLGLTIFALIVLVLPALAGVFGQNLGWLKGGSLAAYIGLALLYGCFWFDGARSPWRWLWRECPILNTGLFPDINGVWVGVTKSNWPIINEVRQAAAVDEAVQPDALSKTPLQEDVLVLEIRASLFRVKIEAFLASPGGTSSLVTAKAVKTGDTVRLFYVYHQKTPEASDIDEALHVGAAELDFDPERLSEATGEYWTRRRWRQGLNTAGLLQLRRVGERDKSKSLAAYGDAVRRRQSPKPN